MPFYIQNLTTNLVFDVQNSSKSSGAQVIMMPFNNSPGQIWVLNDQRVHNTLNGFVLTIGSDNCSVVTGKDTGNNNSRWTFEDDETIRCVGTGKVIDICSENKYPKAKLIVFAKHGGWNQQFRVIPV